MVHIPDRGLAGIYKECLQINKKKQKKKTHKKTVESGQETRTDTSQKRTPKWANKHMKNSHYHYSSGECRL